MALALISCGVSSLSFCLCTACTSLLTSCCGNDKPSSLPPSVTSGRKRSVSLLVFAVALALAFQYGVAPAIVQSPVSIPVLSNAWVSGCNNLNVISVESSDSSNNSNNNVPQQQADDNSSQTEEQLQLQIVCAGNGGVYRVLGSATFFFLCAAIAAYCQPTANRQAWPFKVIMFLLCVGGMCCVPTFPLFNKIYLNVARIGGVLFILVQQVLMVDMAHNWNNAWVERSNAAQRDDPLNAHAGRKWLISILLSCLALFTLVVAGLIYLFFDFTGCPSNNAFISITLIAILLVTSVQLLGSDEGSLLASSVVSIYAVYLLYNAVSKNPDSTCNPMLGVSTPANIVLGLFLCTISLAYTGWSTTAETNLLSSNNSNSNDHDDNDNEASEAGGAQPFAPPEAILSSAPTPPDHPDDPNHHNNNNNIHANEAQTLYHQPPKANGKVVTGVVMSTRYDTNEQDVDDNNNNNNDDDNSDTKKKKKQHDDDPRFLSNSWRLNVILTVVSCWATVVLTNWGGISTTTTTTTTTLNENQDQDDDNDSQLHLMANPTSGTVAMWMVMASQWIVLLLYVWTLVAPRLFPDRDFS